MTNSGNTELIQQWLGDIGITAKDFGCKIGAESEDVIENGLGSICIGLFSGSSGARYSFRTYYLKDPNTTFISIERGSKSTILTDLNERLGETIHQMRWSQNARELLNLR